MGIWAIVIGVILIAIGIYELMAVRRNYKYLKSKSNRTTSPFMMLALWQALLFSGLMFFVGIGTMVLFYK
ncbi:hypothetical protein [Xylocopilactobacillus apicola]|uniref:Immunity protein n=1 Tax=Xylocopilactobacillus apicola TaxID=2932184 RepID=A0AAU9DPN9_9LACO|nr:hypothetical protein [Xylocopilactobacillus apicola]BDR59142.1 hypothetical protein XA3_15830 [Xylocopilactobacillus apicola]